MILNIYDDYDDFDDSCYVDEEEIIDDWVEEVDTIPERELRRIFKELETENPDSDDEYEEDELLNDKFNI